MEKKNTNFHNEKLPKEGSQFICRLVILIDLFLEQVNTIILKFFERNATILLKKK